MRISGNLALNPAYRPAYQPSQNDLRKKADATAAQRAKAKQKKTNLVVALIYIAVIFSVAFCLVVREVRLYEKSNQVNALQTQVNDATAAAKQAQIAAEQEIDLALVEELALTKFNMSKPQKHQTVYINVRQSDYVEKVAEKKAGEGFYNGISAIFGIFGIQ